MSPIRSVMGNPAETVISTHSERPNENRKKARRTFRNGRLDFERLEQRLVLTPNIQDPTPDQQTPHWFRFDFDGAAGAQITGDRITLHYVDGERGDLDLTRNGIIVDPGAPAFDP